MSFAPDCPMVSDVVASPNVEPRHGGRTPGILLLHYTGLPSMQRSLEVLADPACRVSCHYVLDVDGRVVQMVPERLRAWHAGLSNWAGESDINSLSVGIEIQNPGHAAGYPEFPEPQMAALEALCRDIISRHGIAADRVLAHSDVAPLRKIDPGERLDWRRLWRAGVGLWVEPEPVHAEDPGLESGSEAREVLEMQRLLRLYGYGVETNGLLDEATGKVVAAFQRHFRPARVDGRIDQSTRITLERLLQARDGAATS